MSETKLPPGPWRAKDATRRNDGSVDSRTIEDAAGKWVLVATDWGEIAARSPEVLRAIEALPLLVEAARKAIYGGWMSDLRDALALVDDVDRPHP